jgi:hypothetical protein
MSHDEADRDAPFVFVFTRGREAGKRRNEHSKHSDFGGAQDTAVAHDAENTVNEQPGRHANTTVGAYIDLWTRTPA